MKHHLFYRLSWLALLPVCMTMVIWMACSKELADDTSSSLPLSPSSSECADVFADTLPLTDTLFWQSMLNDPLPDSVGVGVTDRAWPILYTPSPLKGCPNSTFYIFRVYDGGVGAQISVKFTTPSGSIVYASMARSGVYQLHSRTLMQQGRYKIQYVWTSSKTPVSSQYWWIDNTAVTLNTSGLSHIVWPFGSDGSTNTNRLGWYMSCGHGCNTHTTQNGDYYAEDWNRSWNGNGNADYLHDFRSPLDGKIVNVEYRPSTYGHMVDIEQTVGTQRVWFRIAHLSSVSVQVGNIVYAGVTKIGTIGYSGNVSPSGSAGAHAHCVLYKVTSAGTNGGSIDFDFDAVCNGKILRLSLLHVCNATRSGISTPCFWVLYLREVGMRANGVAIYLGNSELWIHIIAGHMCSYRYILLYNVYVHGYAVIVVDGFVSANTMYNRINDSSLVGSANNVQIIGVPSVGKTTIMAAVVKQLTSVEVFEFGANLRKILDEEHISLEPGESPGPGFIEKTIQRCLSVSREHPTLMSGHLVHLERYATEPGRTQYTEKGSIDWQLYPKGYVVLEANPELVHRRRVLDLHNRKRIITDPTEIAHHMQLTRDAAYALVGAMNAAGRNVKIQVLQNNSPDITGVVSQVIRFLLEVFRMPDVVGPSISDNGSSLGRYHLAHGSDRVRLDL